MQGGTYRKILIGGMKKYTLFVCKGEKMLQNTLNDKYFLLTGATSGIGERTAYLLAEEGCYLVLVGRNSQKLAEMKEKMGSHVLCMEFDLQKPDQIQDIFDFCKNNAIKLDGFVYCAGIAKNNIVRANDWKEFEEVMRINCMSFVEMGKYFSLKKYSNDGASIVVISSLASLLNDSGMIQYSASKSALNSAVKTMAKEFLKRKIRVNAILPANVNTNFFLDGEAYIENFMENAIARQPLGIIDIDQVSYLIEFLLSDNSKFMTGELLTMSGGMTY